MRSPTPGWVTRTRRGQIGEVRDRKTRTETQKLYLAVIVAAELGEGTDEAFEKLDAALKNQPQDSGSTTMPLVPTPWHLRLLPGRTRRGAKRCQSEPSACSARRSRTATPITGTCRRMPTSTLSGTFRLLPTS